jgi:hypothetical protein
VEPIPRIRLVQSPHDGAGPNRPLTEAQVRFHSSEGRLHGQRGRLFDLLSDGKWHSNADCAMIGGLSFNGAIYALRQKGWIVESRYISRGEWHFRLIGKGEPRKPRMNHFHRHIARRYTEAISAICDEATLEAVHARLPIWMRP